MTKTIVARLLLLAHVVSPLTAGAMTMAPAPDGDDSGWSSTEASSNQQNDSDNDRVEKQEESDEGSD